MNQRLAVKICGLSTVEAIRAAADSGAAYIGFVFFPPSPRAITPDAARMLAQAVPAGIRKVAVLVDADDTLIDSVVTTLAPDLLQLHGNEPPEQVARIRKHFDLPAMKAIRVAGNPDIERARPYYQTADYLLFDARPPTGVQGALPGGNGLSFDWSLLAGRDIPVPWFLSGGLDRDNLADAVRSSGARAVDTSSGVEDRPGVKNIARIRAFLSRAQAVAPGA